MIESSLVVGYNCDEWIVLRGCINLAFATILADNEGYTLDVNGSNGIGRYVIPNTRMKLCILADLEMELLSIKRRV